MPEAITNGNEKKKTEIARLLQKFKGFYSSKANSPTKKLLFWVVAVAAFIALWPLCLGGLMIYTLSTATIEQAWLKSGLMLLVAVGMLHVEVGWAKNLFGMNTPPTLVISSPAEETTEVEGVSSIEISGMVKPAGSTVEIDGRVVEVDEDGNFTENIPLSKGRNEIKIVGRRGSGETKRLVVVRRELTEEEIAEEKRLEEERKAKAEAERQAREEAKKKAEEEARAKEEAKINELSDVFCRKRGEAYSVYVNLDDFSTMLEQGRATLHNVFNQVPSRASCRGVAEQCLKTWPEADCEKMAEQKIWIGMTENQLILSWGIPRDRNDTVGVWGVHTQWVYGDFGPYVYLEGKSKDDLVVTSWQD